MSDVTVTAFTRHKMIQDVAEFHSAFGHPIMPYPQRPPVKRQSLRRKLLVDEFKELIELIDIESIDTDWPRINNQIVMLAELGDWIADMIYYLIGTALEYGLPLAQIWDEVQRANMAKLWSQNEVNQEGTQINLIEHGWSATFAKPPLPPSNPDWKDYPCYQVKDKTGKVRKPPSWKEPDIVGIINIARGTTENLSVNNEAPNYGPPDSKVGD